MNSVCLGWPGHKTDNCTLLAIKLQCSIKQSRKPNKTETARAYNYNKYVTATEIEHQ